MKLSKSILLLTVTSLLLSASKPFGGGYNVGDTVADFNLKNIDGKMLSLGQLHDVKGAIVIFDCNTCPVSKAYNARIIDLHKKFNSEGFPVIAINANDPESSPGDSFEEMKRVAKAKKYDFPYLIDESQRVAKTFGATNTPHVFVLKKSDNEFKVAYIGAIDNNARDSSTADKKYVEDAVKALLSGKEIKTPKTKALGCGIKWKNT